MGKIELIYGDLTETLIGCFFEIHNTLGVGYDEKIYHRALAKRFSKKGVPFVFEPCKDIVHRGKIVGTFKPDLLVYDKIILELKCLRTDFIYINHLQLITYLKLWQKSLGLLVNFGQEKVIWKREPFTEKPKILTENYDYIDITEIATDSLYFMKTIEAIKYVFEIFGLGYGGNLYKDLLETELDYQNIPFAKNIMLDVQYEDESMGEFEIKPFLVDNTFLCEVIGLYENIHFYDISKMQTYLRNLNLKAGIIAHFGKRGLEIRGIRP